MPPTTSNGMHVVVEKPGSYRRLQLRAFEVPRPGPRQVLVATTHAGVNYADCIVRMGLYQTVKRQYKFPVVPGFEFAGVVAALGEGVTDFRMGQRVCGISFFHGYSTHVCVPQHQLMSAPDSLGMAQAAGVMVPTLTAWYAVIRLAHVQPGEIVLVHSAAGGVGGALCQVARSQGARVIGVVGGAHKVDAARTAGCTEVIDYSAGSLWQLAGRCAPSGYDVVFDAVGVRTLAGSYKALAPTGRLVTYGSHSMLPRSGGAPHLLMLAWHYLRTPRFNPIALADSNKSVMGFNLSYLFEREAIARVGIAWVGNALKSSIITPSKVTEFPFERVADAHRALESGRTTGKLVLRVAT